MKNGLETGVKNKSRQANIELLRILAMFGILIMHMTNHSGVLDYAHEGVEGHGMAWLLFSPGMHSINIFLLITGYFMVKQRFSTWKLARLTGQVLFYALAITFIFRTFFDVDKSLKMLIYSILPISSDFYWYASMYAGLLLLSPVLNKLIFHLTRRQLLCLCILCFALVSVWPNIVFFSSGLNTAGGVSISWFISVYLFGAYIRLYYEPNFKWKIKMLVSIGLLALLPATRFGLEALIRTPLGEFSLFQDLMWGYSIFYNYSSILITITSIAVFITFLNIRINSAPISKVINTVAGASFGVYLLTDHAYVRDYLWRWIGVSDYIFEPLKLFGFSLGIGAVLYAAGTVIELLRQLLFSLWEKDSGLKRAFLRLDERLKDIWNGQKQADS